MQYGSCLTYFLNQDTSTTLEYCRSDWVRALFLPPFLSLSLALALLLSGAARATSPADISAYLTAHNSVREQHGAADLTWDDTLASAAQTWVNKCVFEHSGGSLGPYGGTCVALSSSGPREEPELDYLF